MILMAIALAAQVAPAEAAPAQTTRAQPTAEAVALGRQLAEAGTLASLLPMMVQMETEELVRGHSELSAAEQARLREVAATTGKAGMERLMAAEGNAFATALTIEELRALVAFHGTAAARRYREALPGVIGATMASVGELDFKADVRAAFCKETGKLCGGEAD